MAARPSRMVRYKALRLACWNAEGVRGRDLELEHFLREHGVDISLLIETYLNPDQPLGVAKYDSQCTERQTAGSGTAILVRRGTVQNSVPVPGLTNMEATAVQVTLACKPEKILAAYL